MSSVFTIGARLHVYFSQNPEKSGCLERLRQLTLELYDRDVVVDLALVTELSEQGLLTLLILDELLRQAGHKLILHAPSPAVKEYLAGHNVAQIFTYSYYQEFSMKK